MQRARSRGYRYDPIACVYPRIYVGAGCQLTPEMANHNNITHVINCASLEHTPNWFLIQHPNRLVILNAIDSLDVQILDWYPAFERELQCFLRDPSCKNVYVHCECGINRSMFLSLAFVVDHFNIPFEIEAHSILFQRPCALTNTSFWAQVYEFSKSRANKYGSATK